MIYLKSSKVIMKKIGLERGLLPPSLMFCLLSIVLSSAKINKKDTQYNLCDILQCTWLVWVLGALFLFYCHAFQIQFLEIKGSVLFIDRLLRLVCISVTISV